MHESLPVPECAPARAPHPLDALATQEVHELWVRLVRRLRRWCLREGPGEDGHRGD
jgi:hypothetical protein